MSDEKPSLPADYVVPKVWEFEEQEGAMGGMNRPTAGARKEQDLKKGEHDLQLYSLGTPNGIKVKTTNPLDTSVVRDEQPTHSQLRCENNA